MGRKIKKVIMIAAFGMVTGGQIADLLPEGNVMQVEAGSRKQIIKVKNKGKDSKKEFDKDKDNAKDNEKDLVEEGEKEDRKDSEEDREKDDKKDDGKAPEKGDEKDDGKDSEKDDEKEDGKDPEKDDEKEDGKDSEKDDEKDDGKDLEKDDEKENGKDPEEEEIKMYHAEYEDPDGQNGYYISAPTGKITHLSKNGVTRYLFENGNGERQEGTLEKLNESCRLKQLNFADGRNELEVWMEDEEHHQIGNYFKMLNGYSPTFTSFSGGVYEMDLTRTAINNFATHCSKLKPEIEGSALKSLEKTLQHKPNYFMDTTKFIKRLATYVAVEHTAFIIPIEDEYGRLCGWYPLRAERCEVVESERQLYLRYLFANGSYGAIEFERVGIMTDFEYKDDLFGEDNSTLAPTMQLIHTQNEGIINAVKNSANIRFLAKVANILKPEDIKKERKRFTEDNLSADNDSGMIIYDNKFSELKQVESKPYTPNALQMQNIQENVCTHFGTNMDILQNKFDENTWNAYYEGKIEPFAIQLSLVMTNMSFTERERACGNAIFFSANRLQYASNATKLSVSTQLFDRALLNRNGVMDIWNMAHVEDGEKYYIRKEYTEVSELHKGSEQPVIIQQVPQQTEPAAGEEPQNGQEEKEGVNNAS